jgi:SAM-dependent methyltransferase
MSNQNQLLFNDLKCPISNEDIVEKNNLIFSKLSNNQYFSNDGVFRFLSGIEKNLKTEIVKDFYLDFPFPNYNNFNSLENFVEKGNNLFIEKIIKFVKPNDKILEMGSGTCQLGNYLALSSYAQVYCADLSFNSLKLGSQFKKKFDIKGVNFFETDIFNSCFKKEIFDIVICTGVLHHTKNPEEAFYEILKLLKKDGLIIIGLYNKISRFKNSIIKFLSLIFGEKIFLLFDSMARSKDGLARLSWIKDQYFHPLEKRFTYSDLHKWFIKGGVDFIESIPSYRTYFDNSGMGINNAIEQFNLQIKDFFISQDGGLFIFFGKKK